MAARLRPISRIEGTGFQMTRQAFLLLAGFAAITLLATPSLAGERDCNKAQSRDCATKPVAKPLVRPLTEPLPMRKGERQRSRRVLM
jgi:hypothetical protein